MGFNKRYITKDIILDAMRNGNVPKFTQADDLVLDNWSSMFFRDYVSHDSYQEDRKKIEDDTMFSSNHNSKIEHENYKKLKSLPNILENLIGDPSWTDILLTFEILGKDGITELMIGKFDKLKELATNKIINHYTTESRDKTISNIIDG